MNLYGEFFWFAGVVENNLDPLKLGRLQVRIFGYHTENKTLIEREHLPWAQVVQPVISSANSGIGYSPTGILNGTHIIGFFRDGDRKQQPVIMGTYAGIPKLKANIDLGFNDPLGIYPLVAGENDVNQLSRNDKEPVNVTNKKDTVEKGVTSAAGVSWTEPYTQYASEYPKNHTRVTESGHIEEFDDTPAAERINREHRTGTFVEWHPDGSEVKKIVGDEYEIIAKGKNVLIKGICNVTINGDSNIKIGGNANVDIAGDAVTNIDGNETITVLKDINMTALGKITIAATQSLILKGKTIQEN
jgi:hypothetical protein